MEIKLGNLTVDEIEKRCNIKLSDEDKEFLKNTRQDNAQHIEKGKWHCFDLPFQIVTDEEMAEKLYKIFIKYEISTSLSIAYN